MRIGETLPEHEKGLFARRRNSFDQLPLKFSCQMITWKLALEASRSEESYVAA